MSEKIVFDNIANKQHKNGLLLGTIGVGRAVRCFKFSEFDVNKAYGYGKIIKIGEELRIQVIDAHDSDTQEDINQYLQEGYVKID